jgi:hypothetical protein
MIIINDPWWNTHGIYIKQAIQLVNPDITDQNLINIPSYDEAKAYCINNQDVFQFHNGSIKTQMV